ncbi:MAG: LL-diaminopimelate aminotransferase [Candidatus Eremiobacteraeota bacterium]|nr:LL-diaminopimelate aminotransferase [Candidatus Eremiobacteraeota bacterium]
MEFTKRFDKIPPYLFAELNRLEAEKKAQGVDVISLGVGDPDTPTAPIVVDVMKKAVEKAEHHVYPPYAGTDLFRNSVSNYYKRRFGVDLDPGSEVLALLGSKEGIAHLSMAVLDPGDLLLVPDPGYPVYRTGAIFAGAQTYTMPLLKENNFLPDFGKIPEHTAYKAKMMFLNYPNNPTAAVANLDFYKEAVEFARKYGIILCSDNSYPETYFDCDPPPSILSVEGAKDIAVEFYSLSKPYNMTGWRIAALVGNREVVNALTTFKKNIDSGTFTAIQEAGAYALDHCDEFVEEMREIYRRRMVKMVCALKEMGIDVEEPEATFYIWAPTPDGMDSFKFTLELLEKTGIIVSPGSGFGRYGEGFFRISLTISDERIDEAVKRLKSVNLSGMKVVK